MIYAYVMKFFLPGFCTHSCNAFWSLLTWRGLLAIPTKAMISKNSASPASQSWCTSSPPNNLLELWKVSKHNHAIVSLAILQFICNILTLGNKRVKIWEKICPLQYPVQLKLWLISRLCCHRYYKDEKYDLFWNVYKFDSK